MHTSAVLLHTAADACASADCWTPLYCRSLVSCRPILYRCTAVHCCRYSEKVAAAEAKLGAEMGEEEAADEDEFMLVRCCMIS